MISFHSGMLLVSNEQRLLVYNDSAARIWNGLAAGADADEIARILSHLDGADPERVRCDVEDLIAEWRTENVLPGAVPGAARASKPLPPQSSTPERWICRIRGRTIGFAVDDPASAHMVRLLLEHLIVDAGAAEAWIEVRQAGGGESAVLLDGRERARVSNGIGLRDTVHAALFELVWPERPISALIHGGAIARGGSAICFAGSAGSGKTTLIAHLSNRGFDYLGDDMVPADRDGVMLPWPTPLSLKQGSWDLLGGLHADLAWGRTFEAAKGPARLLMPPLEAWDREPTPIAALVFPSYEPEAAGQLMPLEPLDALSALFHAGLWLGHPLTEARVRIFLDWFERVPAFALAYSRLDEAERLVAGLLQDGRG